MIQTGKTVNARQTAFMLFAVVTVYKLINLPQALVEGSGRDAWLGAILLMAFEWAVVGLICLLVRLSPSRTLEQIIARVLGRTVMKIVMALFGLFLCVRLTMTLTTTEQFLMTNLYDRTGWIPFGLPILLIMGYGATKGLRSIGRVNELVGIVLLIGMLFGVAAITLQADLRSLLPVLHGGAAPVFRAAETVLLGTGEAMVLLLMVGRTESAHFGRNTALAMLASTLIVVLFQMSFFGFYGEAGVHFKHGKAISDMLQYMRGSDSLARIDIFVVAAVLMLSLMKMMIYAWGAGLCVSAVFDLQKHKRGRLIAQIPVVGIVWVGELLIQTRIFDFFAFLRGAWKYLLFVPFEIILPVFVLICALILSRREKSRGGYRLKAGNLLIRGDLHEPTQKF